MFWDQALIALDPHAGAALPARVQRKLTLPRAGAAFDGLREYAFSHQIPHQVTYATVLKRIKRELHRKLSQWFAAHTGLRANDFRGHRRALRRPATKPTPPSTTPARPSTPRPASPNAALGHVQRALALLDTQAPVSASNALRWRLLEVRHRTLDLQGRRIEQLAVSQAMQALTKAMNDDHRRAWVEIRCADLAVRTADWPACERSARLALALAERASADEFRLRAMRLMAHAAMKHGELETGMTMAQAALAESRRLGLTGVQAVRLTTLTTNAGAADR